MSYIKNKILINFFIILLFIFLLEGMICQPEIGRWDNLVVVTEHIKFTSLSACRDLYFLDNFWKENGVVENLQALFILFAIIILFLARPLYEKNKVINFFLIIKIISLIYYLGEEISWGQHFFKWTSSDWFITNNNQNETNIHNISNFFDQVPRTLVLIWCGLSVPIILMLEKRIKINRDIFKIVCPSKKLIFISLILLLLFFPDFIIDKFNLHPGWTEERTGYRINNYSYFFDILTFNFVRLSELHETIFSFYFLLYANSFLKKID